MELIDFLFKLLAIEQQNLKAITSLVQNDTVIEIVFNNKLYTIQAIEKRQFKNFVSNNSYTTTSDKKKDL